MARAAVIITIALVVLAACNNVGSADTIPSATYTNTAAKARPQRATSSSQKAAPVPPDCTKLSKCLSCTQASSGGALRCTGCEKGYKLTSGACDCKYMLSVAELGHGLSNKQGALI
jgi:hypothetical protein